MGVGVIATSVLTFYIPVSCLSQREKNYSHLNSFTSFTEF